MKLNIIIICTISLISSLSTFAKELTKTVLTIPPFDYSLSANLLKGPVKSVTLYEGKIKRTFGKEELQKGRAFSPTLYYDKEGRREIEDYDDSSTALKYIYDDKSRITEIVHLRKDYSQTYIATRNRAVLQWEAPDSVTCWIYRGYSADPQQQLGYKFGKDFIRSTAYLSPEAYAERSSIRYIREKWEIPDNSFNILTFNRYEEELQIYEAEINSVAPLGNDAGYAFLNVVIPNAECEFDRHGNWVLAKIKHDYNPESRYYIREIRYYDDEPEEETMSAFEEKNPAMGKTPEKIFEFAMVEQQAEFPGGQTTLMKWLFANMSYPPSAQENNIQGRVIVKFIIEKDGTVSNPTIVRGVDPDLDKEAIRVVKKMPKWKPGLNNGTPVRTYFILPLNFKLQN